MCCGSVLSMVLRILFLPLIPLAHWFQNPGDVATLHALRPLLFCFIFYSMGIEQRKPWIRKKSRVGHYFGRAQPLAQATKQSGEYKSRITHPGLARTVFIHNNIQEIFFKINTTFHFLLEKNLHRPNKPKACHSEMSITPCL